MDDKDRRKIVFIESDDPPETVRISLSDKKVFDVDLFVRKPDDVDSRDFSVAARLCGCRRICLAFIDPD